MVPGTFNLPFKKLWKKPTDNLDEKAKAVVLNQAGFALRAVGRLREAAEPIKAGMELQKKQGDWKNVAIAAGNLSELYLTLGEIERSVEYGRKGVEYADKSGDEFQKYAYRTTLADAFHQAGEIEEAEKLFYEAEEMQKECQGYEYLYSLQGYRFCDLLLGQGKYKEVQKRIHKLFEWRQPSDSLLDIGFENLSLGRAHLLEVSVERKGDFGKAREYLDKAVNGLREAGTQHHLPRGLLGWAEVFRHTGEFKDAWRDVEEAREIAERGEMKLFMVDCALEACRLNLAQKAKGKAKEELKRAKELIERCGYHRRDKEIEKLVI